MIILKSKLINWLLNQHRYTKKSICVVVDISLCVLSVWFAYYLRLGEYLNIVNMFFPAIFPAILIFLTVFNFNGVYNQIFRYSGSFDLAGMSKIFLVYGMIYFVTIFLHQIYLLA